ncbi:BTR2-like protein [Hordeum vulgare]|nr:BTR2-like protein [Hordeum vulgare]
MEEWTNLALAAAGESLANTMTRHMGGDFVDLAIDRIKSISRFHAVRSSVFSLCVRRIGLQGNALWYMWQFYHADEARHAETAMMSLRSAKSHGHAAVRVFERMLRPPSPQAVARAWAPAAVQLLRRAIKNLAMAEVSVGQIRPAIVVEYNDARRLLHASI